MISDKVEVARKTIKGSSKITFLRRRTLRYIENTWPASFSKNIFAWRDKFTTFAALALEDGSVSVSLSDSDPDILSISSVSGTVQKELNPYIETKFP